MNKKPAKTKKIPPLERIAIALEKIVEKFEIPGIAEKVKKDDFPVKEGYITFPEKTAQQIVDECDNKVDGGKLLWITDWYKNEDFFTEETCRPRTVIIPTEIEMAGKSWNECHESSPDDMFNFAEIMYMLRESESFRKLLPYPNDSGVYYTWTSSRDSGGGLVIAGGFDSDGAHVDRWGPGNAGSNFGVCLSRS